MKFFRILDQEERSLARTKNLKSIIFRYARYNEVYRLRIYFEEDLISIIKFIF